MQDKQKVTLYLPPELHRQLKIQAAVDSETMTDIAQRAIGFYLAHPEVVERIEEHGQVHRVYCCPECTSSVVLRDGEMFSLRNPSHGALQDRLQDTLTVDRVKSVSSALKADSQGEGELVPC